MEIKSIEITDDPGWKDYVHIYIGVSGSETKRSVNLAKKNDHRELGKQKNGLNIGLRYDHENNNKISCFVLDEVMHIYTSEEIQAIKGIEFAEQIPEIKAFLDGLERYEYGSASYYIRGK